MRVESLDSPLELPELEICERYEKIFSAAVNDVLRENMIPQQILPNGTIPLRDRHRDADKVLEPGFPLWVRYRNSNGMLGRFRISGRQTRIRIGNVFIQPGDLIFADIDGVIIVPREICVPVLLRRRNRQRRIATEEMDQRSHVSHRDRKTREILLSCGSPARSPVRFEPGPDRPGPAAIGRA